MNDKFYQDFAGWLDRWLQHNVDVDPSKLDSLPFSNQGDELKPIAIAGVFRYINRHQWPTPQKKTAEVFNCSRRTVRLACAKTDKLSLRKK